LAISVPFQKIFNYPFNTMEEKAKEIR